MASRKQNLFSRLTSLFKSGPIVKRQIRGVDSRSNSQSSAIDVFRKNAVSAYGNSFNGAGTMERLSRYATYGEMDMTPECASALNTVADETVAKDEKGYSLHIHSENPQIKRILEELFYDTINVEFNMRPWVRNLAKYGDLFLLLDVSPQIGIQNVYPLPVNEMEREEGFDPENPSAVRFKWSSQNKTLENWMVAHFRLQDVDTFLPYGVSYLEPARKIWHTLVLLEDAMLVYRIIRSPERRVFYIDVANAPVDDVPNILEQARTTLKSQEVVDRSNGRVDMRLNPWSVDIDYFLPVRGTETGTRIDTLPGGVNTTAIDDVEYIQRKLIAALRVPKPYLGFDEAVGKSNLSQQDIRFSRVIQQIQAVVISELEKIAAIHLASHGFDGEDLLNFRIQLSNPSTIAQQQKLELIEKKLQILGTRPEGIQGMMLSDRWLYKEVVGLTDEQIDKMEQEQFNEMLRKAKIEKAGMSASEGGGGGSGGLGGGGGGPDLGGGGGLDLGLDDEGGGDDLGLGGGEGLEDGGEGGEDLGGDEEDLFASNSRLGPLIKDEEDETISFTETEKGEYQPVNQQNQLTRYRHNNSRPSRKKQKGSNWLKQTNPGDALNHDDKYFTNINGTQKGSSLKLSDALNRHVKMLDNSEYERTRLSKDLHQVLKSFSKEIGIKKDLQRRGKLISESFEQYIDGIVDINEEEDDI